MKITLVSHMPHTVTIGGAEKSLRMAMECLSDRGHCVSVVCPYPPGAKRDSGSGPTVDVLRGVTVIHAGADIFDVARHHVLESCPDIVVVPAEDPSQRPLQAIREIARRVAVVAQTPATLPFGPGAALVDGRAHALLRSADSLIASSRFLAAYIRDWGGLAAVAVPLPLPLPAEDAVSNHADRGAVMMINPSKIKGVDILASVAAALPHRSFIAVQGWATSEEDVAALSIFPNVKVWPSVADIYSALRHARVLMVPSLWLENIPLVVTEAMLAGVPVCAADIGGISEVGLGAITLLPVVPLRWDRSDRSAPVPVSLPQPERSWVDEIERHMSKTPQEWRQSSRAVRSAALEGIRARTVDALESELESTVLRGA